MAHQSKTKIICTIGPAIDDEQSIADLISNGMTMARLNGAHNVLDWHREVIRRIRKVDDTIPILVDLPGRKIRFGSFPAPIECKAGDDIVLAPMPVDVPNAIPVNYDSFHLAVRVGGEISVGDGTLRIVVKSIEGKAVTCTPLTDGQIRNAVGLAIDQPAMTPPVITAFDERVTQLAVEEGVDFVGFSFTESSEDVDRLRRMIGGNRPAIISKIETPKGTQNVDSILEASDGILLDRGDLALENRLEDVGILQKIIVQRANSAAKPVIVATEMLRSMVTSSSPTKAEVTDVTNAIIDGGSAVMLSEETAIGLFPMESVRTLRDISSEVEKHEAAFRGAHSRPDFDPAQIEPSRAIAEALLALTTNLRISKIVVISMSGYAARLVSSYRPAPPVLVVTREIESARQLQLLWGVTAVHVPFDFDPSGTKHILECLAHLWDERLIADSDTIAVAGVSHPKRGNRVNMIEVHAVEDLVEAFGWATRPRKG